MINSIKKIMSISDVYRPVIKRGILFGLLYSVASGIPILIILIFIREMVNNELKTTTLLVLSISLLIDFILQYIFNFKETATISAAGYDIVANERKKTAIFLRTLAMGEFLGKSVGNIQSIITGELTNIELYAMQMISKVIRSIATMIFTIILLMYIDIRVGICFFAGIPFALIINSILQNKQNKSHKRRFKAQENLINSIVEYAKGIETIRAYNSSNIQKNKIQNQFEIYAKQTIFSEIKLIPWMKGYALFLYLGIVVALFIGSNLFKVESLELYKIISLAIISTFIYQPLEILSSYTGVIKGMKSSLNRLDELKSESSMDNRGNEVMDNYYVEFKNVEFSYEKEHVIKNISFKTNENTLTALVGPSGSGKSTIGKLLMRYQDVEKGDINIGGKNIKDYSSKELMKNISIVFQENILFKDTIANNIGMGKEGATIEEIQEVAKKAGCHEFIMKLDNKYETVLKEGGNSLSGGQKQKIAIARAFLKNAPIIILDEVTSKIDPTGEYEIQKTLEEFIKNRTVFVITHKLGITEKADKILVINNGKIEEEGNHETLINKKGLYFKMWQTEKASNDWKIKL